MNIQELAKQAIERINSMSLEELEKKFIEHGYNPSHFDSFENCNHVIKLVTTSHGVINTLASHNVLAANQPIYFCITNDNISLAA